MGGDAEPAIRGDSVDPCARVSVEGAKEKGSEKLTFSPEVGAPAAAAVGSQSIANTKQNAAQEGSTQGVAPDEPPKNSKKEDKGNGDDDDGDDDYDDYDENW